MNNPKKEIKKNIQWQYYHKGIKYTEINLAKEEKDLYIKTTKYCCK